MYKLNGATGDKTGLGITLRVMAGDNVSIYGKSYWTGSSPNNSYSTVVNDLLTALAATSAVANAGKGATAAALTGSGVTPGDVSNFLSTAPLVSGRPKAYINWILFDEQFRAVSSSSGFSAVNSTSGLLNTHTQGVSIARNGYLYVYCSNESDIDVFFDNLQVVQTRGPLLEETHYYPFGLTMAGISSKAAGKLENRYKYNGIELDTSLGLNAYEAHFRDLDPAIGRWWQIDPKIDGQEMWSPYSSMADNPVLKADPLGDTSIVSNIWNSVKQGWNDFNNGRGTAYKAADWFNRNLNPLTDVYHAVTGRDFETGERTSRSKALMGIGLMAVGGKVEMAVAKTLERSIISDAVSGVEKNAVKTSSTALTNFYPSNNGFLGATERSFLMPGEQISRYGSSSGKFFSPVETPLSMRALPPGSNTGIFNTYKVLKPFEVEAGKIAPAFGQPGLGTQYLSPVSTDVLLKRGIIGH